MFLAEYSELSKKIAELEACKKAIRVMIAEFSGLQLSEIPERSIRIFEIVRQRVLDTIARQIGFYEHDPERYSNRELSGVSDESRRFLLDQAYLLSIIEEGKTLPESVVLFLMKSLRTDFLDLLDRPSHDTIFWKAPNSGKFRSLLPGRCSNSYGANRVGRRIH